MGKKAGMAGIWDSDLYSTKIWFKRIGAHALHGTDSGVVGQLPRLCVHVLVAGGEGGVLQAAGVATAHFAAAAIDHAGVVRRLRGRLGQQNPAWHKTVGRVGGRVHAGPVLLVAQHGHGVHDKLGAAGGPGGGGQSDQLYGRKAGGLGVQGPGGAGAWVLRVTGHGHIVAHLQGAPGSTGRRY